MEKITVEEAHSRFRAQGVSAREHIAFKCVICGTVQSMASLIKAGCKPEQAENCIGFSCEGRFSDAGPWPSEKSRSKASIERRKVRGCDWTLGGFFKLHKLSVICEDGKESPTFEIATAKEAQALEALMTNSSVFAAE